MPECTNCLASIPPAESRCPKCGSPVAGDGLGDPELAQIVDKVHALLVSANLKKLRGDLDGAIQECIKALRVNPDSVEAHSLLGDIYRDQGNLEEAERWYQIALDLNPDSKIDQLRLDQLRTLDRSEKQPKTADIPLASPAMINWLMVGVLCAIILILLAAIIWPLLHGVSSQEAEQVQVPRISNLAHKTRRFPGSNVTPTLQQGIASEQESTLLNNLNASSALTNARLQVVSITIDPRRNSAMLTYIGQVIESPNRMPQLVKDCLTVAREAFRHDPALMTATVRALYSISMNGRQSTQTVFVADTKRETALQIDPATSDISQQSAALENVWYNAGIASPAPQPGVTP